MTRQARIPMALKLAYTIFVAILVPYYWVTYSAWNFLFFCDLALLMTLPLRLWLRSHPLAFPQHSRGRNHSAPVSLGGRLDQPVRESP